MRIPLLDWLTFDRIDPEELSEALSADPDARIRNISVSLRGDLSLRLVWVVSCICPNPAQSHA